MADEHAAAPPPGSPGQRALGAMESAVRRAREAAGVPPLPAPTPPRGQPITPPAHPTTPVPVVHSRTQEEGPPPTGPHRWLIGSVAAVAVLVAAAAVALLVSLLASPASPPPPRSLRSSAAPTSPVPSGHRLPVGGGPTSTSAPPSSSTTTSTTSIAVAPAGPPEISALSPSSGSAGQSITIAGANFLSTNGQIVATFDGQVAPTSCPAQSTCTVTVPPSTSPSAQVVITTAGGASNAVTFSYD
jgi:hypothetical protein